MALSGTMARPSQGRVLIVDDEEPIREALDRTLRRLGYDPSEASGGETGLAAAQASDPDVIFLDLRMPGMDGLTFLRQLQAAGNGHPPSVVVMSGQGNMDDVIEVMRLGAVDYLRKPWNLTELMTAVNRAMEARRKSRVPAPEVAEGDAGTAAAPVDEKRSDRFAELSEKLRRGEIVLPATPAVLTKLRELVANPESSLDDIAAAVEKDPRIAADVLRVANSPIFTRLGRTLSVKAAVGRLGLKHVHNLAQTIFLQGFCDLREGPNRKLSRSIWHRSVARAVSMRALCDVLDPSFSLNSDTAYLVGLMSDIGATLLIWVASERSQGSLSADDARDTDALLEIVRSRHEQLGAALLDKWKFEKVVSVAVSRHHLEAPPVSDPLWWSLSVLGNDLASRLLGEEDPTAPALRDRVVVDRCAAEFRLPGEVLDRLVEQLKGEFAAIQGNTT